MNNIYSKVWNRSLGQLVVASELAHSNVASGGPAAKARARLGLLPAGFLTAAIQLCLANASPAQAGTCIQSDAQSGSGPVLGSGSNRWLWCGNFAIGISGGSGGNVTGFAATGIGDAVVATGDSATAYGRRATATAVASVAIGVDAKSVGTSAVAVGVNSSASGINAVAIGGGYTTTQGDGKLVERQGATASGSGAVALGANTKAGARAEATDAIALGGESHVAPAATSGIAVGRGATVGGAKSIAMGDGAQATGTSSISIGTGNIVNGARSGALGDPTYINADDSYAIGNNNTINANQAFVLGNNVIVDAGLDGAVVLGNNSTAEAAVATPSSTVGGISYGGYAGNNPAAGDIVSVGAAGAERQIKHVAAGQVSSSSTDAINGSQLYATQTAIGKVAASAAQNLGGGATVNPDGSISAPSYTINGNSYSNVGDALAASSPHYFSVNDQGTAGGNYANDGASGTNALAAGVNATAYGNSSIAQGLGAQAGLATNAALANDMALGTGAKATGGNAIALGSSALASTAGAVAIGRNAHADSSSAVAAVAVGDATTARGQGSVAIGAGSNATSNGTASGGFTNGAVALGRQNAAAGQGSVAIGNNNTTSNTGGTSGMVAVGESNTASANGAVAIGKGSRATSTNTVALGVFAGASGSGTLALGFNAGASGNDSIALGTAAITTFDNAVAIGNQALVTAANGIAIGKGAHVDGLSSISIGTGNVVRGNRSGALGDPTYINADDSYAIGNNNTINSPKAFVLGNNVTVGAGLDGAVVLGNNATAEAAVATPSSTVGGISYGTYAGNTPAAGDIVSVGAAGAERQIKHVAAGQVSNASTDAINGSQLYATQSAIGNAAASTAQHLGGGSTVNPDGSLSAPAYTLGGTTYNNVGDALSAVQATASSGWDLSTQGGTNTTTVAPGASVDLSNSDGNLVVSKTTADNNVTFDLAKDIAVDSLRAGDTVVDGSGVTVNGGANPVSLTSGGLDNGGNTITHVGDAVNASDAVNLGQLQAAQAAATTHYYSVNDNGVVGGNYANDGASGTNALAAGVDASAPVDGGTALGAGAVAAAQAGDVALGAGSTTDMVEATTGTTIDGIHYDFAGTTPTSTVSVGAAGAERTVTHVAAGRIDASSTDAINGSQLYATHQAIGTVSTRLGNLGDSVASGLGGGSTYDPVTGTLSTQLNYGGDTYGSVQNVFDQIGNAVSGGGIKYFHANSNLADSVASGFNSIGIGPQAVAGTDDAVAIGNGAVAGANTGDVALGAGATTGAVVGTSGATIGDTDYSFAGANPTSTVSVGAAGAERSITNVAAGRLDAVSTDAVNGSQLYATNQQVGANTTSINNLITQTSDNSTNITNLQQDALQWNVALGAYDASHGGGSAQKITNVAEGELSASSTDAVNGSQLYATNQLVNNISNGAGIKYFHASSTLDDSAALGTDSIAVGPQATAYGNGAIAQGVNAVAGVSGDDAVVNDIALGNGAMATGGNAIAQGSDAVADATGAVAIGQAAAASAQEAVAIGAGAVAGDAGAVALGAGSTTAAAVGTTGTTINGTRYDFAGTAPTSTVSVGATGAERTVTHVAAGRIDASSTDAINGSQLYATHQSIEQLGAQIGTLGNNAVQYDDAGKGAVTLAGATSTDGGVTGGTTVTNLHQGELSPTSTDAVNGAQLYATNQQVAGNTTAITNLEQGKDGYFQVNDSSAMGKPQASGDDATAGGAGAVASGSGSTAVGAGAQATASDSVAIGGGSVALRANSVSVGVAGSERQVTNVAAGTAATDAVNVSQLQAAQAGSVHYDTNADGSINYSSITLNPGGSSVAIHNVAPGTVATDAVSVGQLEQGLQQAQHWSKSYTDRAVNNLGHKAFAGVASAIAMASMPQAYQPNQSSAGVALGNFHGESGIAVGLSSISESGRMVFKVNASTNTRGDAGVGVGAGVVW